MPFRLPTSKGLFLLTYKKASVDRQVRVLSAAPLQVKSQKSFNRSIQQLVSWLLLSANMDSACFIQDS